MAVIPTHTNNHHTHSKWAEKTSVINRGRRPKVNRSVYGCKRLKKPPMVLSTGGLFFDTGLTPTPIVTIQLCLTRGRVWYGQRLRRGIPA